VERERTTGSGQGTTTLAPPPKFPLLCFQSKPAKANKRIKNDKKKTRVGKKSKQEKPKTEICRYCHSNRKECKKFTSFVPPLSNFAAGEVRCWKERIHPL
jgi:hypothetical protein